MRALFTIITLLSLGSGCRSAGDLADSATIERTILWRMPVDPATWDPIELTKLLHNSKKFATEGAYWFKPQKPITVFGHEALFVGAVGFGEVAGPNATLKGRPPEIAKFITERYGIKFVKNGEEYHGNLKETAIAGGEGYRVRICDHVSLVIAQHPQKDGESVVIGVYSGP